MTDQSQSPPPADDAAAAPAPPFADLDAYLAIPRLAGLDLSPDGTALLTAVAELSPDRTTYRTALWRVDPTGADPARRLTRSVEGEAMAAFTADGSVLFASKRPDPGAAEQDPDARPALMLLPADGGEARPVASRPGGFDAVAVARGSGAVVVVSPTLPGSGDGEDDAARRKARKERKIDAVLHASYPIRYWDHDLGPDEGRLLVADAVPALTTRAGEDPRMALRDLTPQPGRALDEAAVAVAPDGSVAVTTWYVPDTGGRRVTLVAVDLGTGERRTLLDDPDLEVFAPSVDPSSTRVAVVTERASTAETPPRQGLAVVDLASGELQPIDCDVPWPDAPAAWTPDGTALIVGSDRDGRRPLHRVDVATGQTTVLTGDHGAYTDPVVSPDGRAVYALRSAVDAPPAVVRLDAAAADQQPTALQGPATVPPLPGSATEVTATAADGTPLRAWLCLPDGASADAPAPFLLWVHGGPLNSWNAWSWRWNPWLMVARGYAVLLPDPALSTGYGDAFIERGWGAWGDAPYTDLMALTDAALERPDVDAARTAAMGGSFGGYMANWIATQTDRFDAIVTHASLWALDQFGPTTDAFHYWRKELTAEMALANSPHRFVDRITTPVLVIHGDRDYRVPIGEGLRLWAELAERHQGADGQMPHRFLLFPGENHWVLAPQHSRLWYETVLAFLRWHVLGEPWEVPELLT